MWVQYRYARVHLYYVQCVEHTVGECIWIFGYAWYAERRDNQADLVISVGCDAMRTRVVHPTRT